MTDPRDNSLRGIVNRHHQEDDDAAYDARMASERHSQARASMRAGDHSGMAAAFGMTDLAVRIAKDARDAHRDRTASAAARERARAVEALRKADQWYQKGEYFRAQLEVDYLADEECPHPMIHFLRGVCRYQRKEYAAALPDFARATRFGAPETECTRYVARCHLSLHQPEQAERILLRAIKAEPDAPDLGQLLAVALLERNAGPNEEKALGGRAVALLLPLIALKPGDGPALFLLGKAQLRAGNAEAALVALFSAERNGADRKAVAYLKSLAAYDLARLDEASRWIDEAVESSANDTGLLSWRGFVRRKLERFTDSVADFTHVIEREPKRIDGYLDRGETFRAAGKLRDALRDFKMAAKLAPTSPRPGYHLARCLIELDRGDEALAEIDSSIRLGPDFEPALEMRERILRMRG